MEGELIERDENYIDYHLKSHGLIYSTVDLTSRMMDIIALMLTEMQESDWDDHTPEYKFSSKQLSHWFGVQPKQLYSVLHKPSKQLAQREIGVESDGKFRYNPILSGIEYDGGTLTISPNPKLKDVYIINASQNGHAKIDNKIFKSLSNPNTKRVFEFLCRYRYDSEMYFIDIRKLQIMFGVYTEKGEVLKPAYRLASAFINRLVGPALSSISKSEVALDKLEILTLNGKIGYEIVDKADKSGQKIRFLVKWKNQIPQERLDEMARRAVELTEMYKRQNKLGQCTLEVLIELEPILRALGYEEQADSASNKIKAIEAQNRKKEAELKKEQELKELKKLDAMLKTGLLDDL